MCDPAQTSNNFKNHNINNQMIAGYHMTASIALNRSSIGGALYSSAILLRSAGHKWGMYNSLQTQVARELVWFQGGEQPREDAEYAEWCMRHTLLRLAEHGEPDPAKRSLAAVTESLLVRFDHGKI